MVLRSGGVEKIPDCILWGLVSKGYGYHHSIPGSESLPIEGRMEEIGRKRTS